MLAALGFETMDQLIDATVPTSVRDNEPLRLTDLPGPMAEHELLDHLRELAGRNRVVTSMIGQGYYGTHTPAVIQRNVLENPAWYTAYTPYQPEISQGRLETLLNFQTVVQDLTGLDLAGASLLDEATAAAEALTLCRRQSKSKATKFLVDVRCHPQVIAVVATRAAPLGIELDLVDPRSGGVEAADYFGALLAYPATDGTISDFSPLTAALHEAGALVAVTTDLLACTLLTPPGEWGADIAVGSAQRFGVPMGAGGPHAGFMAVTDKLRRSLPGRLVGVSVDAAGRPAMRLALQTREQHIRREKATSNICTAQVLLAVMAASYATYHGPEGLLDIAERIVSFTEEAAEMLGSNGVEVVTGAAFDTLWVSLPGRADAVLDAALKCEINLRRVDGDTVGLSVDETTTPAALADALVAIAGGDVAMDRQGVADALSAAVANPDANTTGLIPANLVRTTPFLTHPTFHSHRTETEMLRYLRRLSDADLALDRSMIPLGSCTMKLNATTEMLPVTWPEFAGLHPFAPAQQTAGYQAMLTELEHMLRECTGYDAISLQPNAGSQGEYAGLLAIRRYHQSRGDQRRNICLIPSSAHGTNPASAALAGMEVVIVECDAQGNVDLEDLRAKAGRHRDELACIMVTYPSTHGVFEESIVELCEIVHEHGGQVYVDGANLNALVGIAAPGKFGADVSHLNLHKTFCIPHGGGGPGMGPIGVGAHLQPFLPSHPVCPLPGLDAGNDVVSAAPYGSASILPISWSYIALMGGRGLTQATRVAILSANYIAHRLKDHYPILYTGKAGTVAHECILDIRPIKEASGVTEEDVAKRLIDYGFHAPTMSFPVAGTLMVEPTESESLQELDRFCDAMIAIREEITAVQEGRLDAHDNPLANAPHTLADVAASHWDHPYSRELAAYPVDSLRRYKYWAPVNRVDNVYGDRNLFCACPAIDSYRSVEVVQA